MCGYPIHHGDEAALHYGHNGKMRDFVQNNTELFPGNSLHREFFQRACSAWLELINFMRSLMTSV